VAVEGRAGRGREIRESVCEVRLVHQSTPGRQSLPNAGFTPVTGFAVGLRLREVFAVASMRKR
jgi:hypothetical protein